MRKKWYECYYQYYDNKEKMVALGKANILKFVYLWLYFHTHFNRCGDLKNFHFVPSKQVFIGWE